MTTDTSRVTQSEPQAPANRLAGRRIVITGAASGIGRATARLFAREGASLALVDRDERGVGEVARETGSVGFQVDITNEAAVADVVEKAGIALGGIDGVVNSAGIMSNGRVPKVAADAWRRSRCACGERAHAQGFDPGQFAQHDRERGERDGV